MKLGRNDPCPCGSGKKYKKCCLSKSDSKADYNIFADADPLDILSNQTLELINNKQYDKAQKGCERLLQEFPDVIDGLDRFAMLYEKMGDITNAILFYKKCISFINDNPDGFDPKAIDFYNSTILKLQG